MKKVAQTYSIISSLFLQKSQIFNRNFLKKRLCRRYFRVNFAKMFTIAILQNKFFSIPVKLLYLQLLHLGYCISSNCISRYCSSVNLIPSYSFTSYYRHSYYIYQSSCNSSIAEKLMRQISLAKWLSVRLRSKWLWVRVPLQSLKEI